MTDLLSVYKQALMDETRIGMQSNDPKTKAAAKKKTADALQAMVDANQKTDKSKAAAPTGGGVWDYLMGSTK